MTDARSGSRLNVDPFFGFDRLMQAFGQTPALHHTARNRQSGPLPLFDDIILIRDIEAGFQRLVGVMNDGDILNVIKAFAFQQAFSRRICSSCSVPSSQRWRSGPSSTSYPSASIGG